MAIRLRMRILSSLIIPAAVAGSLTAACGSDGGDGTSWQPLGAGGACSIYGPSPGDPDTRDAGTNDASDDATPH